MHGGCRFFRMPTKDICLKGSAEAYSNGRVQS